MPLPSNRSRTAGGVVLVVLLCLLGSVVFTGSTASATSTATSTTAPATTAHAKAKSVSAYWLVASDGGIFSFGGAPFYGSTGGMALNKPVVGMAGAAGGRGYWLVASDGGIFSFGQATFYGSTGGMALNKPVVGMAAAAGGGGYWLVASDGGIFSFGDAHFYGSMGGHRLNRPVVGMAATPDGHGYWLVASDGGIFSFGDATFYGSTGSIRLNRPIVGMTAMPSGHGYWFTASDGGVFAFGSARFYGSLGDVPQSRPIVAMAADASGNGYWFANNNGAVTAFGGATYWGSAPQVLNNPVVGMAEASGSGHFTGSSYPPGSYGYDISNYQCPGTPNGLPPSPHTIGIVEVEGGSMAPVNPCLAQEAAWAGGGLNLYVYLTYGTAATSGDPACQNTPSPSSCNVRVRHIVGRLRQSPPRRCQYRGHLVAGRRGILVVGHLGKRLDDPGVPRRPPLRGAQHGGHLYQPVDVGRHCGELSAEGSPVAGLVHRRPPAELQDRILLRRLLRQSPSVRRAVDHPIPVEHLRRRLRLLRLGEQAGRGRHQLHGVVVAEEPPPVTVDLPGGHGGVPGP